MTKIIPLITGCRECPYGKFINDDKEYECELTELRMPYTETTIEKCLNRMLMQCPLIDLEDITTIKNYIKVVRSVKRRKVVWKSATDFFSKLRK